MKKAVRIIVPVIYAASFAYVAEKIGCCCAYKERGYEAFGGEYIFSVMVLMGVYKAMRLMFNALEDEKAYEKEKK